MSNKILLIGSQGQLGRELEPLLTNIGSLISLSRNELDLTQPDLITKVITEEKPQIIINAAAYTAVDKAETETSIANAVNGVAPGVMARAAETINASLIHISTDYVFDGSKNTPYLETDTPNPIGAYGKSKLQGEQEIQKTNAHYLIVRTAWVYGVYGKQNFVKTMLRLAKEREVLKIVSDQVGTPSWAGDIAEAIASLAKLNLDPLHKSPSGIYHFTNSGVASWYDFAIAIFAEAAKRAYQLQIKEVIPITTAEYPTPAQRPAYSVLSNRKLNEVLGNYPPYWRDSLLTMLDQLLTKENL